MFAGSHRGDPAGEADVRLGACVCIAGKPSGAGQCQKRGQIWVPGSGRGPGPWCALLWLSGLPRGVNMATEASDGGGISEGGGGPRCARDSGG